eukprot:11160431-Lingulodinium_polyedra.AAC.1
MEEMRKVCAAKCAVRLKWRASRTMGQDSGAAGFDLRSRWGDPAKSSAGGVPAGHAGAEGGDHLGPGFRR